MKVYKRTLNDTLFKQLFVARNEWNCLGGVKMPVYGKGTSKRTLEGDD